MAAGGASRSASESDASLAHEAEVFELRETVEELTQENQSLRTKLQKLRNEVRTRSHTSISVCMCVRAHAH